jgi:hypothetical protein
MDEGRAIGARDLVLAIFRLAVADYLGLWYGHDDPASARHTKGTLRSDAEEFLLSSWSADLGDLVGIQSTAVWREARRLYLRDEPLMRVA